MFGEQVEEKKEKSEDIVLTCSFDLIFNLEPDFGQ